MARGRLPRTDLEAAVSGHLSGDSVLRTSVPDGGF